MAKTARPVKKNKDLDILYASRVKKEAANSAWVLRITEHKDKSVPVFLVKERLSPDQRDDTEDMVAPRSVLKERGLLYGEPQTRVLPVIRTILSRIHDTNDVPLELHKFLSGKRINFRGNLPLDEEAGCKLVLIFKLQERIKEMDRVELMARRIDLFTKEEAAYWYSRITSFGPIAGRWALTGMKIMMAGQSQDPGVEIQLTKLRGNY